MVTLFVVSTEAAAGKTAIGAALGGHFAGRGKKVAFPEPGAAPAADVDVAIIEGMLGISPEDSASKAAYETARTLAARVIIVATYAGKPALKLAESYRGFGSNLSSIILNKVPASQLKRAREEAAAICATAGIKFLGALPEDRLLAALTVGELAESVSGKILTAPEKSGELIENFMLGAMVVDSGPEYFGRKSNKAAILRSDRPDMQLAALETSTRCLVLSHGSEPPIPNVLSKATRKGVPVILAAGDTNQIIAAVENALGKVRFSRDGKLSRLAELAGRNLDFKTFDEWAAG